MTAPDGGPGVGPRLASTTSALLRDAVPSVPHNGYIPEGPHFNYDAGPDLFLGRRGTGPLHVAWDTNLLVDYFNHGSALWEGASLPDAEPTYGEELEGLQLIVGLWVIRDIRFHILPRVLSDARRRLPDERREERANALREFSLALTVMGWYDDADGTGADGRSALNPDQLERSLLEVPKGGDRDLIREACHVGAHVFLTRDARVLRCNVAFRSLGLLIATPLDLLEELIACGAFHCMLEPVYAYWPVPDLQRVTHLIRALPK